MNHCSINHLQWRISLSGEQLIKTFFIVLVWLPQQKKHDMHCSKVHTHSTGNIIE